MVTFFLILLKNLPVHNNTSDIPPRYIFQFAEECEGTIDESLKYLILGKPVWTPEGLVYDSLNSIKLPLSLVEKLEGHLQNIIFYWKLELEKKNRRPVSPLQTPVLSDNSDFPRCAEWATSVLNETDLFEDPFPDCSLDLCSTNNLDLISNDYLELSGNDSLPSFSLDWLEEVDPNVNLAESNSIRKVNIL